MHLTQRLHGEVKKGFFFQTHTVTSLRKSTWSLDKTQAPDFVSRKGPPGKPHFCKQKRMDVNPWEEGPSVKAWNVPHIKTLLHGDEAKHPYTETLGQEILSCKTGWRAKAEMN